MATLIDARFNALRGMGFQGTSSEMLFEYWKSLIPSVSNLPPALVEKSGRWFYNFGAAQYARLPSEVVMGIGTVVEGEMYQQSNAYSHVLGHFSNSAVYFQAFPNDQTVELRLSTHDGYVGAWNDPTYVGYLNVRVKWILTRLAGGYNLKVDTNNGAGLRDLGTLTSNSAFRFNTVARSAFAGYIWNIKVNDGAVWHFPFDDGTGSIVKNKGSGGDASIVGFSESNWIQDADNSAGSLNDAWFQALGHLGRTEATLTDRWFNYLRSLNHTGSMSDMELQYWASKL